MEEWVKRSCRKRAKASRSLSRREVEALVDVRVGVCQSRMTK